MTMESWILIIALLLLVVFRQLGEREFTFRSVLLPFIICGIFAYKYLGSIPTDKNDIIVLVIMTLLGAVFGLLMTASVKTKIKDNKRYTICGVTYLLLWIVGLGWKIIFSYYAQDWYPETFGKFMITHHLSFNVIGPAFIFFTFTMIIVRVVGVLVKFKIKESAITA